MEDFSDPNALADFLQSKASQFEHPDFIENDPISIPHQYQRKEDIEIMGLMVATIAWGNRISILKSGKKLQEIFGESPYDFVMNHDLNRDINFVHRTFQGKDLAFFIRGLRHIYQKGGLEFAFQNNATTEGMAGRLANFRERMLEVEHPQRCEKHISNPLKNASCKRLNMYLRWMVRSAAKGVDFGIWKSISPAELYIPLDVHTGNVARKLGILERTQNDWKSNEMLIEYFKTLDPLDPAKFDFALFGLGAMEKF